MSVRFASVIAMAGAVALAAPAALGAPPLDAPGVRAAVVYSIDGPAIVRSKGIEKVTNPSLGLYCVKLKDGGKIKNAVRTVPVASVESDTSKGNGANSVVVVATNGADCPKPKKWITVRSYATDGSPTDDASWNLIVP